MDKRKEANLRVKNNITEALFRIMENKSFAKITVTDIIKEANVARASFYRNFDSKEDILIHFVIGIFKDFNRNADYELSDYFSYENVRHVFTYLYTYKKYILELYHTGFGFSLMEALNEFLVENAGIMPAHSIEKYNLYIFAGALFNSGMIWLENDTPESVEEISEAFCRFMGIKVCLN